MLKINILRIQFAFREFFKVLRKANVESRRESTTFSGTANIKPGVVINNP